MIPTAEKRDKGHVLTSFFNTTLEHRQAFNIRATPEERKTLS